MKNPANLPIRFASDPAKIIGQTRIENGQTVATATKEIVQAGQWWKDGKLLDIPPSRLSHWKNQFDLMLSNGMKVPVPVDHTRDPEANRGWVTGMDVVGDKLVATMELIGEDAIKLAARSDVSIQARDLTDNKGNAYPDAIEHTAFVSDPFITGLGKFAIQLSRATALGLSIGGSSMESLKKIASAMGIDAGDMDEMALTAAILAAHAKAKEGEKEVEVKLSAASSSLSAAQSELTTLKLSAKPVEVDPDAMEDRAETIELKLSALRDAKKISPAVCKGLVTVLAGTKESRPILMLSTKAAKAAGLASPIANQIIAVLSESPAPEGDGEITSLSRNNGGTVEVDQKLVDAQVSKMLGK